MNEHERDVSVPTCDHCGAETVTVWIAEDEMWREFNGSDAGIACTDCFVRWALARDVVVRFRAEVVAPRAASRHPAPDTGGG